MRNGCHYMLTRSGVQYYPLDPRADEVRLEDIAHALSMLCRYGGHCKYFYSVAEHSVYVSRLVPEEYALVALLHDATEAYCVDVPRPLKVGLSNYKEIEERNWRAICEAFALSPEMPKCVHDADVAVFYAESRVLLHSVPTRGWGMGANTTLECPARWIAAYPQQSAKEFFLRRFHELNQRRINEAQRVVATAG